MNKTVKMFTLFGLVTVMATGLSLSLTGGLQSSTIAEACEHVGNHYSVREATTSNAGTKEYWVCCKCHEHFVTSVSGTWTDSGMAPVVTAEDDRYIPVLNVKDSNGFTYDSTGTTITSYDGSQGSNVVIPEGVTEIPADVFSGNNTIKTVTIPSTVTTIEEGAFQNCKNLESVVIPSSVETIGSNAFYVTTVSRGNNVGNKVVLYVDFTEEEEQAMIASGQLDENWNHSYTSSPFGWGLIKEEHYAEVVYAGQWHLDDSGSPVKN